MRTYLIRATLAAALAVPVVAAPPQPAAADPPAGCTPATSTALAAFFDDQVPKMLHDGKVPGAVVSVVAGGRTVFDHGYGLADVQDKTAMDPARSLVRVASISKLFTWTAVMQQVAAGKLDLTADVNRYLKGFQIPATYAQPVTLLDLMDHTAGFEDFSIGVAARKAADVPPLGDYLATHMPARIRPPGEIVAYSNYGAALAGYIVSRVTGEPYDRYVQQHLLDPLHMAHSTAAQPVPADLVGDLARSYDSDTGRPMPFEFDPMAPDGSVSATADDMAAFMTAQLDGGPILDPATLALMHQRSFAADPRLAGYAHGFQDRTFNGHRVLMHDGGWEGFRSLLMLVPGCDLGLFLSFNGTGGGEGAADFITAFFNRFAPTGVDEVPQSIVDSRVRPAQPREGFYEPTRHNESTVEKVANLLGSARLRVGPDGTVHFAGKDYAPARGGLYRAPDGDHLVFLAGADGQRYVATDGPAYQLLPATSTLPVNLLILLVFLVPTLLSVGMPLARLIRRRPARGSRAWRAARITAAGAAALGLAFLVALTATLIGDTSEFLYAVPRSFRLLLVLPLLVLSSAGIALGLTVRGWRGAGNVARVHQVTLLTGLAALGWFLWQWNLIGWSFV